MKFTGMCLFSGLLRKKIQCLNIGDLCVVTPSDDEDKQEKALSQVYDAMPEGRSPVDILKDKEERRRIGERLLHTELLGYRECKWFGYST